MAYYVSVMLSDRYVPTITGGKDLILKEWVNDRRFSQFGFHGRRFEASELKDEFLLTSRHKILYDLFPINGVWSCSIELKSLIEELEPNVHQFFPIRILRKNGGLITRENGRSINGQYFLFNCMQLIDAILPEKSDRSYLNIFPSGAIGFRRAEYIFLSKQLIAGKHVWCGDRHSSGGAYVFMSDALMGRIKQAKLKGYEATYVSEG